MGALNASDESKRGPEDERPLTTISRSHEKESVVSVDFVK